MTEHHAEPLERLVHLLETAENEHHTYEEKELNGDYDVDWAEWYARYLIEHDINNLLVNPTEKEKLANTLTRLSVDHKIEDKDKPFARYAAEKMQSTGS